ncbi:hypothetical protein ACQJBY_015766 [Aegilops geniculata]
MGPGSPFRVECPGPRRLGCVCLRPTSRTRQTKNEALEFHLNLLMAIPGATTPALGDRSAGTGSTPDVVGGARAGCGVEPPVPEAQVLGVHWRQMWSHRERPARH